jgi:hypothetical protein
MLGYLADRVDSPGPSFRALQKIVERPARAFRQWVLEHGLAFQPGQPQMSSETNNGQTGASTGMGSRVIGHP